jgi:signal transduction histidine kinase
MKYRERGTTSMLIVVAALLLLLPLLAILQYRWLTRLREREQEHMRADLRARAARFSQDLDDELTRAVALFFPSPDLDRDDGLSEYAARYDRWLTVAQYPRLLREVLVARADEQGRLQAHQLKTDIKQFVPCDWPSEFAALREQLERHLTSEPRAPIRDLMSQRARPINGEMAAFIHPIFTPSELGHRGQRERGGPPPPRGFVIIAISLPEIQQEILPALAKRHFSGMTGALETGGSDGFDYSGAIVTQGAERKIIYQFGPEAAHKTEADVTVGLMGLRREMLRQMLSRFPPAGGAAFRAPLLTGGTRRPPPGDRPGPPPINEEQKLWELRLAHRAGSLDAAVASLHRRNLLISFGILSLLAASIVLMAHLSRRAQRLARREMDFVAGVSHELRTPLAVIKSAAWSLTRGVIKDPEQIRRYSDLIGRESDRLIEMIEQVLEFAGARSGRQKLELQPVNVNELIDNVLASSQPLLVEGGFQIEKEIAADLPPVMADAPALSSALRNLIDNAMKYSGESRWIGVQATVAVSGKKAEVRITVSDRGLGIQADDLKYIFDPFWRGGEAGASQIHGAGLGLNLVKTITNAHGGGVSVRSEPGRGSSFTLTLPANSRADSQPAIAAARLDTGATS